MWIRISFQARVAPSKPNEEDEIRTSSILCTFAISYVVVWDLSTVTVCLGRGMGSLQSSWWSRMSTAPSELKSQGRRYAKLSKDGDVRWWQSSSRRGRATPGIWKCRNLESKQIKKNKCSECKSVLPKMIAGSWLVGEKPPAPFWEHFWQFVHGPQKIQNLRISSIFLRGPIGNPCCSPPLVVE